MVSESLFVLGHVYDLTTARSLGVSQGATIYHRTPLGGGMEKEQLCPTALLGGEESVRPRQRRQRQWNQLAVKLVENRTIGGACVQYCVGRLRALRAASEYQQQ